MRLRSQLLFKEAKSIFPGGVSSPIRAFKPFPSFIERGQKGCIQDVDGNLLMDLCLGYGPLILGHSNKAVLEALRKQLEAGLLFGAPSIIEMEYAKTLLNRIPGADMVRFTNSGTEATMHAVRLSRGFTGKNKVVKMSGGFHGAHDSLLVKPGSAALEKCIPGSMGVPSTAVENTLLAEYNDLEGMTELLRTNHDIAAVILEPVMANTGTILPKNDYLHELRKITIENEVLLIFDEVITGLRLAPGGAQDYYSVTPDITTMGKVIGGGLPVGAILGSEEIMKLISPSGPIYMAGTFSGNPMTAAAGLAVMNQLDKRAYSSLSSKGNYVTKGLEDIIEDRNLKACVNGVGSMFQIFIGRRSVENAAESNECDAEAFRRLFLYMLENGYYLPPSQYETNFLCTEHRDDQLEKLLNAFENGLKEMSACG